MTPLAPYRENRFQGFARRFGEFYYATSLRPLAFIGSIIWLAYMVSHSPYNQQLVYSRIG